LTAAGRESDATTLIHPIHPGKANRL